MDVLCFVRKNACFWCRPTASSESVVPETRKEACPGIVLPGLVRSARFWERIEGFDNVTSGVDLLRHAHRDFPTQAKHSSLNQ